MVYRVNKYMDQISEGAGDPRRNDSYEQFDTEDEAKAFILDRAFQRVTDAEKNLAKEIARQNKCGKKFSTFKLFDKKD